MLYCIVCAVPSTPKGYFFYLLHILTSAIPETVCHYLRIMFPNELKDRSFKHYPPWC